MFFETSAKEGTNIDNVLLLTFIFYWFPRSSHPIGKVVFPISNFFYNYKLQSVLFFNTGNDFFKHFTCDVHNVNNKNMSPLFCFVFCISCNLLFIWIQVFMEMGKLINESKKKQVCIILSVILLLLVLFCCWFFYCYFEAQYYIIK